MDGTSRGIRWLCVAGSKYSLCPKRWACIAVCVLHISQRHQTAPGSDHIELDGWLQAAEMGTANIAPPAQAGSWRGCAVKAAEKGFTLVEMLVAVSLLAVIMVALGSSLRTIAQTESRVDQRLGRIDEMRVSVGLMRQLIARVSGRKLQMQTAESGTGQVVNFVPVHP